jgi:hypothetical protein
MFLCKEKKIIMAMVLCKGKFQFPFFLFFGQYFDMIIFTLNLNKFETFLEYSMLCYEHTEKWEQLFPLFSSFHIFAFSLLSHAKNFSHVFLCWLSNSIFFEETSQRQHQWNKDARWYYFLLTKQHVQSNNSVQF